MDAHPGPGAVEHRRRTRRADLGRAGGHPRPGATAVDGLGLRAALADSVSTLPLAVYRDDERDPLPTPPLLQRPSADYPELGDWLWAVMASLLLRGNAWGMITDRAGAGLLPAQVDLLDPDHVGVSAPATARRSSASAAKRSTAPTSGTSRRTRCPGPCSGCSRSPTPERPSGSARRRTLRRHVLRRLRHPVRAAHHRPAHHRRAGRGAEGPLGGPATGAAADIAVLGDGAKFQADHHRARREPSSSRPSSSTSRPSAASSASRPR